MNAVLYPFEKKTILLLFLVFTFGILIYLPSIKIPFINDEIYFIERNQVNYFSQLYTLFEKKDYDEEYYRPVPNFISGFSTIFFKYNFIYYRIINLLLHSFAGVLLFIFCLYLFKEQVRVKSISLFAALFFLAFPLHDYAVIWQTDLFERIMFIFYFLALITFIKNKFKPVVLSILFFTLSLLSKEMAFSLPVVIFLLSFFFAEKKFNLKKGVMDALPYILISAGFVLFRILAFNNNIFTAHGAHADNSLFTIIKNYFLFGGLLAFPFYLREIEQLLIQNKLILLPIAAALLTVLIFLFRKYKKDFLFIFLILFVIVTIAPASRLLMRWYLYLPSAGFTAAISYLIFNNNVRTKIVLAASVLLLFIYACTLVLKEGRWIDNSVKADIILKRFVTEFGTEVNGKEIEFLTIPAKVEDIPVFQLGFVYHLSYYLHNNNKTGIDVCTKSVLSSLEDSIEIKTANEGYSLKQFGGNYFLLFDNKKNIKFDEANYSSPVLSKTNQRESRIHAVTIIPEDNNKILFTFSNGRFKNISYPVPQRGNGKD